MADDAALLTIELPCRPEAASAARKALSALNGDLHLVSETRLHDVQLLVTELVTNAVRHAAIETVSLQVRATPATLRVEVAHPGAPFEIPDRRELPHDAAGGWGLRIVDVVAHRWGTDADGDTISVWFEVDRPSSEQPVKLTGEALPPPADVPPPHRS